MKKTFSIFLLVAALFLCSCEKADIVIRTDLDGAKTTDFTETTEAPVQTDAEGKYTVVMNKSSGVFLVSQDCYHAKIMKEENRQIIKTDDISTLISEGYRPCGVCSDEYLDKENLNKNDK